MRTTITIDDDLYNKLKELNDDSIQCKIEKAILLLLDQTKEESVSWDDPIEEEMYRADVDINKIIEERYRELNK